MGRFTGLSSFFPGATREPSKPCGGCVRNLGPNSTGCPGCDARLAEQKRLHPKRPPSFYGHYIPFGQAGWRVARGRRVNNIVYPTQLHNYGCFMQQGIRHGTAFYRRKDFLPSRVWNTLLDHKAKTGVIRGDGTGTHRLSGKWERPRPKEVRVKPSKYINRPYLFSERKCIRFYHGDAP